MNTKYDWSNVPSEVKWIATDSDMFQVWFIGKPIKIHTHWFDENQMHYRVAKAPSKNEFKGDWKDSLEERSNE